MNTAIICFTIIVVVFIICYLLYKLHYDKNYERINKELKSFINAHYTYCKTIDQKLKSIEDYVNNTNTRLSNFCYKHDLNKKENND